MSESLAIVYADGYGEYKFSDSHPFNPVRVELAVDLIKSYGLLKEPGVELVEPEAAAEEAIVLIHDSKYVDAVKAASSSGEPAFSFGLGPGDNPVFLNMHNAAALVVGGSLAAAELVVEGGFDHSFNPGGGLHHAMRSKASGFCIYNDAAITCAWLAGRGLKVAYVDIDAHHGDGVQWAFYSSSAVLTVSIHESGGYLFPGTGFVDESGDAEGKGYSVNLPLPPGCYDEVYLRAYRAMVPAALRAFKPDVIVSQNGCDAHYNDPLAHLSLTTRAYREAFNEIHMLAHELCEGRLVALGGGGYDLYDAVPRIWTLLAAELAGFALQKEIPEAWRNECRSKGGGVCPSEIDDYPPTIDESLKESVDGSIERLLSEIAQGYRVARKAPPFRAELDSAGRRRRPFH